MRSLHFLLCYIALFSISVSQETEIKTGSYIINSTTTEIAGQNIATTNQAIIPHDEKLTWEITVPDNYSSENPPGILIYISPENEINIPRGWLDITKEKNLIWIAARNSGNDIYTMKRILLAMTGIQYVQDRYKLDLNRIYITGFSGGGRVASIMASQNPNIFKGAIYNCGVNFWNNVSDNNLDMIKENRYVFITGSEDFNLNDTRQVYSKYKKAGVSSVDLMVIPRMGHSNPRSSRLKRAIEFLDGS
ncbi:alpha/beta hydrolase family protein [Pseudemcibacter aquimaris]|uniref:alpha/beta hydrolase family protein n=1 Tax=Pseudemcibacter aquimaris TaxID=2857064 RepID=UPI002010D028|nr:prolyl oligopeptidase family serine peptidase [Pseudemcibacter aquimaris]MCC3860222.1 prolyl oligopeptidase family serine peptidase [Pseudemcibacter aquimaris]WDU57547.1 prolyl oligopeptidase family serine peptidase [Pseudemcibacter aquimaris]